jgi:glucokinase
MSNSDKPWQPPFYLGIDLGGTNIKAGVVDDTGKSVSQISLATEAAKGPEVGLNNLEIAGRNAVQKSGLEWHEIAAVGLGSPGTMDLKTGYLLDPPNLPGWQNFAIRDRLEQRLSKPTILQNDANAAAYGEFWVGAGQGCNSLLLYTLGTGVGGGVIENGRIIEGRHSAGSECGHVIIDYHDDARMCPCGNRGHLEAYASATALVKRAEEGLAAGVSSELRAIGSGGQLTAQQISDSALAGDEFAIRLMNETAFFLAVGAVSAMNIIDPDVILYAGGMIAAGDWFLNQIQTQIKRLAFPVPGANCRVAYAKLGNDAGYIGAAGWARAVSHGHKEQA